MKSETNASNYAFAPVPNFFQEVLCKPSIGAGELDKAIGDAQVVSLVTWSCRCISTLSQRSECCRWEAVYHPAWPSTINFGRGIHSKLIALRHWKGTAESVRQFNRSSVPVCQVTACTIWLLIDEWENTQTPWRAANQTLLDTAHNSKT